MKYWPAIALLLTFVGCSSTATLTSTFGRLEPGSTMTVIAPNGALNVYKPAVGDPSDRYTVMTQMSGHVAAVESPKILRAGTGVAVTIPAVDYPGYGVLVRVPDQVNLIVSSKNGSVNVTDISGNVDVNAGHGDVKIMVPGYAQASADDGNVDVTIGVTRWPGVLKFSSGTGDVNVYIPETAKFHVHMHTDDGTIFTDFGLRGSASGTSETIDGNVNGGSTYGVDIESHRGTVRLLRLAPQA